MNVYTFDVRFFAAIRVKANSVSEARATLRDNVSSMDCNGGAWPNGDPILFDATIDDDELPCVDVDPQPIDTVLPSLTPGPG